MWPASSRRTGSTRCWGSSCFCWSASCCCRKAPTSPISTFGYEIQPLEKATFYFVVAALVIVDIVQGRYQKKIEAEKAAGKSSH